MLTVILEFLAANAVELGAGSAVMAMVEFMFAPFRSLRNKFKKPEKVEISNPDVLQSPPKSAPKEPMVEMSLAQFEERQEALKARITQDLAEAHAEDRAQLEAQLAEVNARLAHPEAALKEAKTRIAELEALLDRDGNEIGGDRLAEAKKALEAGDYSVADGIFAEISAKEAMAVKSAARAAYGQGQVAEAEVRWADAAGHYHRAAQLDRSLGNLAKAAEFFLRSGDYPTALRLGEDMIAVAREHSNPLELATCLNNHAVTLKSMGHYEKAEPLYRESIDIVKETLGERHPDYAQRLNNLALLLENTGRYDEAESLLREAMDSGKETLGEQHPDYAKWLNNLAGLLRATERYDEAEPLFREAMGITKGTLGEQHPDYAIRLNNLASLLESTGRHEEAEPLFREAVSVFEAALGLGHPHTKMARRNLELFLGERGG